MGRIRYIGSKARIADEILSRIGPPQKGAGRFVDMFSGTGTVSRAAARNGWRILANDFLESSAAMTTAQLVSGADVPFASFRGYGAALTQLQKAEPSAGFIYREYTPSGESRSGHQRRYFTKTNGMLIDGMRAVIEKWYNTKRVTSIEKTLLIADLISAANQVANIAGTYGCFLNHWSQNALKPLRLTARDLLGTACVFTTLNHDGFAVTTNVDDVVYLDPPYTKRQYPAYYHIPETIAVGDYPDVAGVTGLRPWQAKHSPFCYKTLAVDALKRIVAGLASRRVVLSYSSEGHIPLEAAKDVLGQFGSVKIHTISQIGRYRPNQSASQKRSKVTEYLIELTKRSSWRLRNGCTAHSRRGNPLPS